MVCVRVRVCVEGGGRGGEGRGEGGGRGYGGGGGGAGGQDGSMAVTLDNPTPRVNFIPQPQMIDQQRVHIS